MQLPADYTRTCIPLAEGTDKYNLKVRATPALVGLAKGRFAHLKNLSCLAGQWDRMLVANWLHLCPYPIHRLFWCTCLYSLSSKKHLWHHFM